jgi:2-methylcitrate dehydratase PrpD
MDCALRIKQKYSPPAEQIAEVICRTAEGPVHRLWEPLADKQKPVSSYGAKFSLPYSIAVMLVRGRAGLEEFSDAAIRDQKLLDLAANVRYELDPTIDYPRHFEGHVKVTMSDGTSFEENQLHPRGGFEDPLPPEEIQEKFRANARLALPANRLDEIVKLVDRLEVIPSIALLTEKLIP